MNKLTIIGNLVRDPELRTTATGLCVCTFTVAVNRRKSGQETEVDYFKVTAWRERGETCAKYLRKGKKVCVIGPVSVSTYQNRNGETVAQMEITADDVEFLSPAQGSKAEPEPVKDAQTGYEIVKNDGDLPF